MMLTCPKAAWRVANSVDPDQTLIASVKDNEAKTKFYEDNTVSR